MADHTVQRVHCLVGEQPGQTQQGEPQNRGSHPVGEILGRGFDGSARYPMLVQVFRVG